MSITTRGTTSEIVDAIYINGKVVTVDRGFLITEAFAVSGDRLVAVGTSVDIRKLAGRATLVSDLGGRIVLPGFIDTHAHAIFRGQEAMVEPSLVGLRSVAEIAWRVGEDAAQAAPGAWIMTSPIGDPPDYFHLPESLTEKSWPTRVELDRVAPRNPVYIPTPVYWPHPAIFNTTALALLGVTRDTPDEHGVRIVKESATGEPTGVIYGLSSIYNRASPLCMKLLSLLPPAPPEMRHEGIRRALKENIAVGVTTIYEGHAIFSMHDLQTLKAAGELTNRVVSSYEIPAWQPITEIDAWMDGLTDATGAGTGDDFLKIVGATVSMDGPVQFGAALMSQPYLDPYGQMNNGASAVPTEQLTEIARLAVTHNLRLNIVAAGDKAGAMAVQALEVVNHETPIADRRWVVQHVQHPSRAQIAQLKDMGMVAQTYASVDFSKGADVYVKRLSGDLWQNVVPLRWWIDGGVTVAQGSDGAHYDPLFQIWESLRRVDGRTGQSLLTPPKTITREEAIQIYTINGARVLQWDDRLGSIEAGKLADFVVLDRDILTCPVDEIRETKVLLTALGGKILYDPFSLVGRGRALDGGGQI